MIDVNNIHNRIETVGQEDRAMQRCNPSAWSMPEDEREHIINNMLPSSCSSFGLKATNLLSWCAAPIIKVRYIKNSLPVGHMSGLYIRLLLAKLSPVFHEKVVCPPLFNFLKNCVCKNILELLVDYNTICHIRIEKHDQPGIPQYVYL